MSIHRNHSQNGRRGAANALRGEDDVFGHLFVLEQQSEVDLASEGRNRPKDLLPLLHPHLSPAQPTLIDSGKMWNPFGETVKSISESSFPSTKGASG